jgi:hypothetical protein
LHEVVADFHLQDGASPADSPFGGGPELPILSTFSFSGSAGSLFFLLTKGGESNTHFGPIYALTKNAHGTCRRTQFKIPKSGANRTSLLWYALSTLWWKKAFMRATSVGAIEIPGNAQLEV